MSNVGKWNRWYGAGLDEPQPYADTLTYQAGADWLAGCPLIADWGCGKGWFRKFIPADRYVGIDGSQSPFADATADLADYRAEADGIFIRHVLEHDYQWARILGNALASARQRLFLAVFTPLADVTHEIAFAADPGVPDLSFALTDLTGLIESAGFAWTAGTFATPTQYGTETVLRCQR
jgi:hypothetical protein